MRTGLFSMKILVSLTLAWIISVSSINPLNKYWTGQTNAQTREKRTITGFLKLRSGLPQVSLGISSNTSSSGMEAAVLHIASLDNVDT